MIIDHCSGEKNVLCCHCRFSLAGCRSAIKIELYGINKTKRKLAIDCRVNTFILYVSHTLKHYTKPITHAVRFVPSLSFTLFLPRSLSLSLGYLYSFNL